MTGQPTGGQWQWPSNAWQPPPVPLPIPSQAEPFRSAPPPTGLPPAGPPQADLPPGGTPAPPRRSRRARVVAAGGTLVALAALLVMCGPGSGDDVRVVALPEASPSATPSGLLPLAPPAGTPSPSPGPSPAPGGAPALPGGDPAATAAAPGSGADRTGAQHASASPHTKAGRSPRPSPSGHAAPNAGPGAQGLPSLGPGTICDQAERVGRWPAGSEQARLCRGVYG